MKNASFWSVTEEDDYGYKEVLFIALGDNIKHIYTIENDSPGLASKHQVHYEESLKRTLNRLKRKNFVYFTELSVKDAILLATEATRDGITLAAVKRIKYYSQGGDSGGKSEIKPTPGIHGETGTGG